MADQEIANQQSQTGSVAAGGQTSTGGVGPQASNLNVQGATLIRRYLADVLGDGMDDDLAGADDGEGHSTDAPVDLEASPDAGEGGDGVDAPNRAQNLAPTSVTAEVEDERSDAEVREDLKATGASKASIDKSLAPLRARLKAARTHDQIVAARWDLFVSETPSVAQLDANQQAALHAKFVADYDAMVKRAADRKLLQKAVATAAALPIDRRGSTVNRDKLHAAQWALFVFDNQGYAKMDAAQQAAVQKGFDAQFDSFEQKREKLAALQKQLNLRSANLRDKTFGFPYWSTPSPTAGQEKIFLQIVALQFDTTIDSKLAKDKLAAWKREIATRQGKEKKAHADIYAKHKAAKSAQDYAIGAEQKLNALLSTADGQNTVRSLVFKWYGNNTWTNTREQNFTGKQLVGKRIVDLIYPADGEAWLAPVTRRAYMIRAVAWEYNETDATRARGIGNQPMYGDLQKFGVILDKDLMKQYSGMSQAVLGRIDPTQAYKAEEVVADALLRKMLRGGPNVVTPAEQQRIGKQIFGDKGPQLVDGTPFKIGDFPGQMVAVAASQEAEYRKAARELKPTVDRLHGQIDGRQKQIDELDSRSRQLEISVAASKAPSQEKIDELVKVNKALEALKNAQASDVEEYKKAYGQYVGNQKVAEQLHDYIELAKNGRENPDDVMRRMFPALVDTKILTPPSQLFNFGQQFKPGERIPVNAIQLSNQTIDQAEAILRKRLNERAQQQADAAGKIAISQLFAAENGGRNNMLTMIIAIVNTYDGGREIDLTNMDAKAINDVLKHFAKARAAIAAGNPFVMGMTNVDAGRGMDGYHTSWTRWGYAIRAGADDFASMGLRIIGGAFNYSIPGLAEWGASAIAKELGQQPPMQYGTMWLADQMRDAASFFENDAAYSMNETGGGVDVEFLRFGTNMLLTYLPTMGFASAGSAVGAAVQASRWGEALGMTEFSAKVLGSMGGLGAMGVLQTAGQDWQTKLATIAPLMLIPAAGASLAAKGVTTRLVGSFLANSMTDVLFSANYSGAIAALRAGQGLSAAMNTWTSSINLPRAIMAGLQAVALEGHAIKGEKAVAAEAEKMPLVVTESVDAAGKVKIESCAKLVSDRGMTHFEPVTDPKEIARLTSKRETLALKPDEFTRVLDKGTSTEQRSQILAQAEVFKSAMSDTTAAIEAIQKKLDGLPEKDPSRAELAKQLEQYKVVKGSLQGLPLSDTQVGEVGVPPGYYKPAGKSEWVHDPRVVEFQRKLLESEQATTAGEQRAYWDARAEYTKNAAELVKLREQPAKNAKRIAELEEANRKLSKDVETHEGKLRLYAEQFLPAARELKIAAFEKEIGGSLRKRVDGDDKTSGSQTSRTEPAHNKVAIAKALVDKNPVKAEDYRRRVEILETLSPTEAAKLREALSKAEVWRTVEEDVWRAIPKELRGKVMSELEDREPIVAKPNKPVVDPNGPNVLDAQPGVERLGGTELDGLEFIKQKGGADATDGMLLRDPKTGKEYFFKPDDVSLDAAFEKETGRKMGMRERRAAAAQLLFTDAGVDTPKVRVVEVKLGADGKPSVTGKPRKGTLQDWRTGTVDLKNFQGGPEAEAALLGSDAKCDIDALDYIVNHSDRVKNEANYLVTLDGKTITPVDNDMTFGLKTSSGVESPLPSEITGRMKGALEEMLGRRARIEAELGRYLTKEEIGATFQRIEQVSRLPVRKGASAVESAPGSTVAPKGNRADAPLVQGGGANTDDPIIAEIAKQSERIAQNRFEGTCATAAMQSSISAELADYKSYIIEFNGWREAAPWFQKLGLDPDGSFGRFMEKLGVQTRTELSAHAIAAIQGKDGNWRYLSWGRVEGQWETFAREVYGENFSGRGTFTTPDHVRWMCDNKWSYDYPQDRQSTARRMLGWMKKTGK